MAEKSVTGMEVKDLNKGKAGQAFEVIIKQPNASGEGQPPIVSPSKKRDISLDVIKTKLVAAEERRKSQQDAVINQLKAESDKLEKVKQKKAESEDNFVSWAEEHLKSKMKDYEENHLNQIRNRVEKYKTMNMKPDELREKVTKEVSEMCAQLEETLQKKMEKSEKLRVERQLEMKRKLKEKEDRGQQVRQNKQMFGEKMETAPCVQ